ncbi:MAG: amidohydrolase family protein [Agriterribacter sp.]
MKKLTYFILFMLLFAVAATAQDDVYPAPEYKGLLFITNGTVHTGTGQVLENTTIQVTNGKIEKIGTNIPVPQGDVKVFDAKGKHIYPGLILPDCDLGLREIASGVRGSNDYRELGELNPNIRSIVSYNTDSKIINTLKANGILLANVSPQGSFMSGSSSVVQLDAWNWEDAAYKTDNGIHVTFPSFLPQRGGRFFMAAQPQTPVDAEKQALQKIEELKSFFAEAKSYQQETEHTQTNLKLAAVKGLFDKSQKLFIHADQVKQMLAAADFVKEFGFSVVIVGGSESWQIAPLLKQHNIAVILGTEHELPATEDEDVDQPYKTPAALQKAGVLFALNDNMDNTRFRNLSFNAGTAAAYGLTKEEALSAITLNAAKILGIDDKTGSLEVGKDANIVVSEGDILDMKSSIVTHAFIQGRLVSLANKQTQLYERYKEKYGLK